MAEEEVLLPRFFKVFLSETASESMAIPTSFTEHLAEPLPEKAKLQGIGGGTWSVSFKKIRDRVYFTSGWSKFAEDHELKDGEFLTFVYDGHRTFEVSVFGRSGFKETRAVAQMIDLSDSTSEEEDTSVGSDGASEETEAEVAVVVESSDMEVMASPSFYTGLKRRIYELLIPANVVKENGLVFGQSITYIDEEGTMVGERGKWTDDRVCFKGWDRICRRNRLKEEDTVKCELLLTGKHVHSIRIHVTRG